MKKLIIMLAVLCCTGVFANDFLAWSMNDANKAQHEECLANPKYNPWYKVVLAINKKLYENPEAFKTYADLKEFCEKKRTEFKATTAFAPHQVFCRTKSLKHLQNDAVDDCIMLKDMFIIHFFRANQSERVQKMTTLEKWRTLGTVLIDSQNVPDPSKYNSGLNLMYKYDIRIPKTEKIEVYSLIYEKLFIKLADEQPLANNKKVWTPMLSKLALKLKSLGVNIVK